MKQLDIYWPVQKKETASLFKGATIAPHLSHFIEVQTPEGPKIVNFCSKTYHLVPNEVIIKPFLAELTKNFDIDVSAEHNGYSKTFVKCKFKGFKQKFELDDLIPTMTFANSYDGRLKMNYEIGFHRVVCSNGMTVPEASNVKLKKMHTPAIEEYTNFDKILEMAAEFTEKLPEVVGPYQELFSQKVKSVEDRVEDVLEATKFPKRQAEEVLSRIQVEMLEFKMPATDWLIYNGFNYQLNHNSDITMAAHKKQQVDQQVLNHLLNF